MNANMKTKVFTGEINFPFNISFYNFISSPSREDEIDFEKVHGREEEKREGSPTAPIPSRDASHFKDLMSMSNFPVTNLECQPFVFHAEEHNSSNCITLTNLLAAAPKNSPSQTRVQSIIHPPTSRKTCSFCQEVFEDEYLVLYKHVKQHLSLLPYECSVCKFAHVDRVTIQDHVSHDHLQATLVDRMTESVSRQCSALFTACFPDVPLQPLLHDSVQKC
ncbi:hypothetical protein WUBG_13817 [Wuchereria bancrofti]|uniref:C2H2-type domain-containing protein n=1 Tax=Wuchereria bancrofti TaxID=6293 RepID=J9DZD1_WUCBA|nr:hypothetical protein WUBG_13817 [Wuchereria bancrofti]